MVFRETQWPTNQYQYPFLQTLPDNGMCHRTKKTKLDSNIPKLIDLCQIITNQGEIKAVTELTK